MLRSIDPQLSEDSARNNNEDAVNESAFPPAQKRLMQFIRREFQTGFNHYNVRKLLGDASSRQYYRYTHNGDSFILAVYPESFQPADFPYRQIYDVLSQMEIPVPEILNLDGDLGIVLQEDLGDQSLQAALREAPQKEQKLLFRRAIDLITVMQELGHTYMRPEYAGYQLAFDQQKLTWELNFFRNHYLENYRDFKIQDPERLQEEFKDLARQLADVKRFFCHRDFHVRNLMLKNGILYVIDFQDARWGPPTYDLMSLLKDSIELELATVSELIDYYLQQMDRREVSFDRELFHRQAHLMTVQRLLKALGTYAYQVRFRSNFIYEQYMSGSFKRCLHSLQILDLFPYIRSIVEGELSRAPIGSEYKLD